MHGRRVVDGTGVGGDPKLEVTVATVKIPLTCVSLAFSSEPCAVTVF